MVGNSPDSAGFDRVTIQYDSVLQRYDQHLDNDFTDNTGDSLTVHVSAFYQYIDTVGTDIYHQYLLLSNTSDQVQVFHREIAVDCTTGFNSCWGDPIWNDVLAKFNTPDLDPVCGMGIVAYEDNGETEIFVGIDKIGLVYHNTVDSTNFTLLNEDSGDADKILNYANRSLNLAPWGTVYDSTLLFGIATNNLTFVEWGKDGNHDPDITQIDIYDKSGAGTAGAGMISYFGDAGIRDSYADGDTIYLPCKNSGLFIADASDTIVGTVNFSLVAESNFQQSWSCAVKSPFNSDSICIGSYETSYNTWTGSSFQKTTNYGLWIYDISSGTLQSANGTSPSIWPTDDMDYGINSLTAGDSVLYIGANRVRFGISPGPGDETFPTGIYVQTGDHTSELTTVTTTSSQGLDEKHPTKFGDKFARFLRLELHPSSGSNYFHGAVYGTGLPYMDWGTTVNDYPGGTGTYSSYGGGIGIIYNVTSDINPSSWQLVEIADCDHSGGLTDNAPMWFESVFDMIVEDNPNYTPGDTVKDVEILAATAAFQGHHMSEDIWRYGGLFRVFWDTGSGAWQFDDLTPESPQNGYQLEGSGFANPAVRQVEKTVYNGSTFYFCVTTGEAIGTNDVHQMDLWYQRCSNIASLDSTNWSRFPDTGAGAGHITYSGIQGYNQWMEEGLVALSGATIFKGSHYWSQSLANFIDNTLEDDSATWSGPILLTEDVTIGPNGVLILDNSDSTCSVTVLGNFTITVDGGEIRTTNASDSNKVILTSSPDDPWGGIKIVDLGNSEIDTLQYMMIENADCGISIDPVNNQDTVNLVINHCRFEGCETGIQAQEANRIVTRYCSFDNCDNGIYLFDLATGLSSPNYHEVTNCEITGSYYYGLKMTDCPSCLDVKYNYIHDNLEITGDSTSYLGGISLLRSSPNIYFNDVQEPGGFALSMADASSAVVDSSNTFFTEADSAYAPIWIRNSNPNFNDNYNNIVNDHASNHIVIRNDTPGLGDSTVTISVENNYWGYAGGLDASYFYPAGKYDYTPYQTSECELGTFSYGTYSTDDYAYDLLKAGIAAQLEGNSTLAYSKFSEVVNGYSEYVDPVCQSLMRMFEVSSGAGISYSTLHDLYDSLYTNGENIAVQKIAREKRNDCSIKLENYSDAIADYEDIMENAEELADSVFAAINLLRIDMIMEYLGVAGTQSTNPAQNLNSLTAHRQKEDELQRMLGWDNGSSSTGIVLPTRFALHQNFPNPFNPTTTILYDLPETADVTLRVFNIMGQHVATLVDAKVAAGAKRVAWDGRNKFGSELSSGMYILQLVAKGESNEKFTMAKKMLLLK